MESVERIIGLLPKSIKEDYNNAVNGIRTLANIIEDECRKSGFRAYPIVDFADPVMVLAPDAGFNNYRLAPGYFTLDKNKKVKRLFWEINGFDNLGDLAVYPSGELDIFVEHDAFKQSAESIANDYHKSNGQKVRLYFSGNKRPVKILEK